MKNSIFLFSINILLVSILACSKSGGSSDASGSPSSPLAPTCKVLYDVWTSDTDLEEFDLTGMESAVTIPEYEYHAADGTTCGYVTNPNHSLTAQVNAGAPLAAYDYVLNMHYSLAMGGQCGTYTVAGSIGNRDEAAYIIESACNQIQICVDANNPTTCKLFH